MSASALEHARTAQQTLRIEGVRKSYGGVQVLNHASFEIRSGELLGIVGENGSGKTTLLEILSGSRVPDRGRILLGGAEIALASPRAALRQGIAAVHQDLRLCWTRSIASNVFLGREPVRRWLGLRVINRRAMVEQTRDVLGALGASDIDPRDTVANLSGGQRQLVEIARALSASPKWLLMDEPTSSLSPEAAERVWKLVRSWLRRGRSFVVTCHREADLRTIATRVLYLHRGALKPEPSSANDVKS